MNLNALGTISTITQVSNINLLVPGSPNQPGGAVSNPIYNNVLGVFRVTELPKLQHVQWQLPLYDNLNLSATLKQYKLEDKDIKYIVNPASGLTIETIQAQIVIDQDYRTALIYIPNINTGPPYEMRYRPPYNGVFQFGKSNINLQYIEGVNDFEKQHNASGLQITNWLNEATRYDEVTIATPFTDLPCVHDQTFVMEQFETFKAYLKFHIVFLVSNKFGAISDGTEGGNTSNEIERVEYIVTYPLEIESIPINNESSSAQAHLVYKVDGNYYPINSCSDKVNFYNLFPFFKEKYRENLFIVPSNPGPWSHIDTKEIIPASILIENTTLTGNQEFKAIESISIGNNVSIANGSDIKLKAGIEILVSDLFEGEEMLQFDIGLDPSTIAGVCEPRVYNSTPNLETICQDGSEYYQRTRIINKTKDEGFNFINENVENVININVFPNPAFDFTTIKFGISQDTKISVQLTNMNGQMIKSIATNKYYPIGNFEIPLDLKELSQGVYLVSISEDNGTKKVYKIVKQ